MSDQTCLILMYHRVATPRLDPWGLSVAPHHFKEHLQVISSLGGAVPLSEAIPPAGAGAPPRSSIVVTFDDGYADNLEVVLPLLRRHAISATVFVCSGNVEAGTPFWWDELAWILRGAPPEAIQEIHGALQVMSGSERDSELAGLARQRGATMPLPAEAPRPLTVQELRALSRCPGVEIGCHTVSHPLLTSLSSDEQRREIGSARTKLEELTNRPVTTFAYPYGAHDPETRAVVAGTGFSMAVTVDAGVVRAGADRFRLPRLKVEDWDGVEFERALLARDPSLRFAKR